MKKIFSLLALLLFAVALHAQSLSPQVVASAGNYVSASTGSLSYTVGEDIVTTLAAANGFLTQGFQQPDDRSTGVININTPLLNAKLYPNPANESVNLWIGNASGYELRVTLNDVLGRELRVPVALQQDGAQRLYTFNLASLSAGVYFVRVRDESHAVSQTIKFTKSTL